MKILKSLLPLILILTLAMAACGTPSAASADLHIVVGENSARFLGNGNGDGLLLDQFSKSNNVNLFVETVSAQDAKDLKTQALSGVENMPQVFVVDDSIYADGLANVKYIGSHKSGSWIRSDVATNLGLNGNTISYTAYIALLEQGKLLTAAGNGLTSPDTSEFFFSVMAWCSHTDASNLTADIVKNPEVQSCGKEVFDHIKSTNSTQAAIDLVYKAATENNQAGYNSVIAYDSAFLGENGINSQLVANNKPYFKFYYFQEATAISNIAIGSVDLSSDPNSKAIVDNLSAFLVSESAQALINKAGFTEGTSALVRHDDSAFIAEWGVASNPSGVQLVNPPISSVAFEALKIYRDYYKRQKIVYIFYDTSGSTETADIDTVDKDGKPETIERLQAIIRSVETFTNPDWLSKNNIAPGPNDVIKHYLFSTLVSSQLSQSTGADTKAAGEVVTSLLGPTYGYYNFRNEVEVNVKNKVVAMDGVTPYYFGGTAMFDAANFALNDIVNNYNPNVDYYIVILTDGARTEGIEGVVYDGFGQLQSDKPSFYNNWRNAGKENISLIGIQFGKEGNSLDNDTVTSLMNGATYDGANDQELIQAFKKILGN